MENQKYSIIDKNGNLQTVVFNMANPVNMEPFNEFAEQNKHLLKMTVRKGECRTEIRYNVL